MAVVASTTNQGSMTWRDLYRLALFEKDKTKIRDRIADAELAVAMRARELFHGDAADAKERQALDTAMYFLHTLRALTSSYRDASFPAKLKRIRTA